MEVISDRYRNRLCWLKIIGVILILLLFGILISLLTNTSCDTTCNTKRNNSSLIFVQVLFRHGYRTSLTRTSYPNDPYKNDTYEPYGPGSLTLKGKKLLYNLGKFLGEYYGDFLSPYHRDIMYAQSSPIERCLNSLLLVLAGLFPPPKDLRISDNLDWQPIPYHYNPVSTDVTFLYFVRCKKYIELATELGAKVIRNDEVEGINRLTRYLKLHTGSNITTVQDLNSIYDHLSVQQELGYELPRWTDKIFPEPLNSYRLIENDIVTKSEILKKLSGGFILKEILDAVSFKVKNFTHMKHRKIHLYSGHDFTITNLLGTLGFKLRTPPTYGSFLSIEVHKVDDNFSIKLMYHDYSFELPQVIKLPECDEMCPLGRFLELYGKYQASPEECDQ